MSTADRLISRYNWLQLINMLLFPLGFLDIKYFVAFLESLAYRLSTNTIETTQFQVTYPWFLYITFPAFIFLLWLRPKVKKMYLEERRRVNLIVDGDPGDSPQPLRKRRVVHKIGED